MTNMPVTPADCRELVDIIKVAQDCSMRKSLWIEEYFMTNGLKIIRAAALNKYQGDKEASVSELLQASDDVYESDLHCGKD